MDKESVTTWADGFGTWHAKITLPEGYGPDHMAHTMPRLRAKARRAIRRELNVRGAISDDYRLRITVESTDLSHMNTMYAVTFREKIGEGK